MRTEVSSQSRGARREGSEMDVLTPLLVLVFVVVLPVSLFPDSGCGDPSTVAGKISRTREGSSANLRPNCR
jgi:hypothetical protein